MRLRKDILFALAVLSSLIPSLAFAQNLKTELSVPTSYDFKADPFLVTLSFGEETKKDAEPVTKEDKLMASWKKKQAPLWETLPQGKFAINASAYTAAADECGKNDGVTASGLKVTENRTLACPASYPFGAKIAISGIGTFRCEDRGGAIKGNHFDIYVKTKSEAFAFGRQHLEAEVVEN